MIRIVGGDSRGGGSHEHLKGDAGVPVVGCKETMCLLSETEAPIGRGKAGIGVRLSQSIIRLTQ